MYKKIMMAVVMLMVVAWSIWGNVLYGGYATSPSQQKEKTDGMIVRSVDIQTSKYTGQAVMHTCYTDAYGRTNDFYEHMY